MNNHTIQGFRYPDELSRPYPTAAIIQELNRSTAIQNNCQHPDLWVLDYSMNNSGRFALENLPWQERLPNTAHLYPPGRIYREAYNAGKSKSGFFLFKGETPILRQLVNNPAGFAQIYDPELRLQELLRAGAKAASAGNQGFWKLNIIFSQLMLILEQLSRDTDCPWKYKVFEASAENLTLPQKITGFLEQNYSRNITLDELAAMFHCSKSTIIHKFRQEYGESVMEMLMRIRVEQSITLLTAGNTLKEIAEAVGFANEFYYSRVFRKVIGISPKQYRSENIERNIC